MTLVPPPGQPRALYLATSANMVGTGMFVTTSAMFFTREAGLSAAEVGLGLSIGGLLGILAGLPVGHLADRRGPREIYVAALLCEAACMGAFVLVRTFPVFVVVTTLAALAGSSSGSARAPLIRALAVERSTEFRAQIRSATNLGLALGGALAAVAVAVDVPLTYLVLGNAVSFAVCAGFVAARLSHVPPVVDGSAGGRLEVLRDRPYLSVVVINAVMMLQHAVLPLVLPLWLLTHTSLPRWMVALVIPVNTVMVALLQVRLSRDATTPRLAARLMLRGGVVMLVSLLLMAALAIVPDWAAAPVMLVGVVVYTIAEIYLSAAGFELAFALAPAHAQGQYMGVYGMGWGLGREVSPSLLSFCCLTLGPPGWLLVGLLFVGAGAATVPVVNRAERKPSSVTGETR